MVGGSLLRDYVITQQSANLFVSANSRMTTALAVIDLDIIDKESAFLVTTKKSSGRKKSLRRLSCGSVMSIASTVRLSLMG
tara:strand:- start:109 stop:351 length:243 start_codon:yes stop_codon:yes gene_type:complete